MRTPSLSRRVVITGVVVLAVLALALDALVYLTLRTSVRSNLESDLDREASLVQDTARIVGAEALPGRLAQLGVRAVVREPDGRPTPGQAVASFDGDDEVAVRTVPLPGGRTAEVAASRTEGDRTLRNVLRFELITTPLVIVLGLLLLRLIAEFALRPLDRIAAAARRTAEGQRGERLRPHAPDTRLGQMASAYDEMLDALESAVADAEAARVQSELLLQRNHRIIETAREAFVVVNDDQVIVDWNAQAERTFGWRRDEAVGRPVVGTVLPDDGEGGGSGLERFRSTGGDERADPVVDLVALHRDGRRFRARMTVWTTHHQGSSTVSAFIWDVTEQVKAEEAVAQLAAIVESADEAMLSTTLDGTVLTWNDAAERMYGFAASEAVGRHVSLVVPEEGRAQAERLLQAVRRGEPVQRAEVLGRCKNGTLIEVALTVSPVRDRDGDVCGASAIARDITEERWIASQLDTTLQALVVAAEEAKASEAATRRFLDDAAHQLRTPITTIRACAEGLLRPSAPGVRDELLGALVRETARAGRLISGLLRTARLHQGQELAPAPCDLVALCRAEADRVRDLAPALEIEVADRGPVPVGAPRLDRAAISEVVANLLDNAQRHAASRIDLSVRRSGERSVEIAVADDGPGLHGSDVVQVFERFVSLDGKGGSGLGLPIARELARAHGGDLTYDGRAFVVRLADAEPAAAADRPGAPQLTDVRR